MTIQILNLNASFDHTGVLKHKTDSNVVRVDEVVALASGKGIDVGRVLKTLGYDNYVVNNIVGGDVGELIINNLKKEGINCSNFKINQDSRINYALVDEVKDDFLMINENGPRITDSEKEEYFSFLESWLEEEAVFVLAGSAVRGFNKKDIRKILKMAAAKKMKLVVDISKIFLKAALEEKLDLLKINEKEFKEGYKTKYNYSFADKEDYIRVLKAEKMSKAIITFGEEGALYYSKDEIYWGTHTKTFSNYAIGSGDSFLAGYIFANVSNWPEIDCFRLALACGVANTRIYGAGKLKLEHINQIKDNYIEIRSW